MGLSVIVILYNEFDIVTRCLRSIYNQKVPGMEVILIDNSDKPGVAKVLKLFPKIRHVKLPNPGFAPAVNIGIQHAKSEFVLILTPDTQLLPKTILPTLDYIQKHSQVAFIGCKFYSYPMAHQPSCHNQFPNLLTHLYEYNVLFYKIWHQLLKKDHPSLISLADHQKVLHPDNMIGVYMLLRKSALKQINYFDNQFRLFREETDLCRRLKNAGWDIIYLPVGGIVHYGGTPGRPSQCSPTYMKSTYLLFLKHYGFLYAFTAFVLGLVSALMSIPVLYATKIVRQLQHRSSQSSALLPCWLKILYWHLTSGPALFFGS